MQFEGAVIQATHLRLRLFLPVPKLNRRLRPLTLTQIGA